MTGWLQTVWLKFARNAGSQYMEVIANIALRAADIGQTADELVPPDVPKRLVAIIAPYLQLLAVGRKDARQEHLAALSTCKAAPCFLVVDTAELPQQPATFTDCPLPFAAIPSPSPSQSPSPSPSPLPNSSNSGCGEWGVVDDFRCWSRNHVQDVDWRYYSHSYMSTEACLEACCAEYDCTGVEIPPNNEHCVFWLGGACRSGRSPGWYQSNGYKLYIKAPAGWAAKPQTEPRQIAMTGKFGCDGSIRDCEAKGLAVSGLRANCFSVEVSPDEPGHNQAVGTRLAGYFSPLDYRNNRLTFVKVLSYPPPPPCKLPPLAIPPSHPGDRHFHVFLVNMYCAGLCCPL